MFRKSLVTAEFGKLTKTEKASKLLEQFIYGLGGIVTAGNFGDNWVMAGDEIKMREKKWENKKLGEQLAEAAKQELLNFPGYTKDGEAAKFWGRSEVCYSLLFQNLYYWKSGDLENKFCQMSQTSQMTIPDAAVGNGRLILTGKKLLKWDLQSGTFELGSSIIMPITKGKPVIVSLKEYFDTIEFQLVSFRQSAVQVRLRNAGKCKKCADANVHNLSCNLYAYFEVQVPSFPFDFSANQNHLVENLLDSSKVTDEQFDNIFGTDLTLKSVQAFSIVDDCLQSQKSTFPVVLVKLLFEYAK